MNEPVAWIDEQGEVFSNPLSAIRNKAKGKIIPLYTHPVKELTDEEIYDCLTSWAKEKYGDIYLVPTAHQSSNAIEMARAILRKAQEK